MTVAVGIELGAGSDAGGFAGVGAGPGLTQAATAPGGGQNATWAQLANSSALPSSVPGDESFGSRWQAVLAAASAAEETDLAAKTETGPAAGPAARLDAESADDEPGALSGTAAETFLSQGAARGATTSSATSPNAGLRWGAATENNSGPMAAATGPELASRQNGIVEWNAATAPPAQFVAGVTRQTAGFDASETSAPTRNTRAAKSGRGDSGSRTEPQAATKSKETLATLNPVAAQPGLPAAVIAVQVLPPDSLAAPKSSYADRAFGLSSEPATGKAVTEGPSAGVEEKAMGTAATVTPAENRQQAAIESAAPATQSEAQDDRATRATALQSAGTRTAPEGQQTGSPLMRGTPAEELQTAAAVGQGRTESGNRVGEEAQSPATDDGAHQRAEGAGMASFQFSIAPAGAGKPGLPSGRQSPEEATARPTHREATSEPNETAARNVLTLQAAAGAEASVWARVPAAAREAAIPATGYASASASTPAAARETFAALDRESGVGTPGWIHAGTQRAEAGFEDPALGWVGVRADLNGGGVHAALLPGSAEAAQVLGGHLAGLNAYLAEQHTPVATLTLAGSSGNGMEAGVGQSTQQDASQNAHPNASTEPQSALEPGAQANAAAPAPAAAVQSQGFDSLASTGGLRGIHISVMA